jgi:hypothetical protein
MVMLAIAGVAIVNRAGDAPGPTSAIDQPDPVVPDPAVRPPPESTTAAAPPALARGIAVSRFAAPAADVELAALADRLTAALAGDATVLAPVVDSVTLDAGLAAARRQGARNLLTGAVARTNDGLLVQVRLVDARTATTLLERQYRTDMTSDVDRLAARIRTDAARGR